MSQQSSDPLDLHVTLDAKQWGALRANTPLTLTESDLAQLRGINENIGLDEVAEIYLPLSRLLSLYVEASQNLHRAGGTFLGNLPAKVPFVIGIAGSVAVGKSTTARILQKILSRWPSHPRVDLVTTDGFLYPNRVLQERSLMDRKGFPESYNRLALLRFLANIKSGIPKVEAPVYSHLTYDVLDCQSISIDQPDILLVEGLTMLQTGPVDPATPVFISDYFDFSIYVDAHRSDIQEWYVQRFLMLRETAFKDPRSYFKRYASLDDAQAVQVATEIWETINKKNLLENILPTRERADLILKKAANHRITEVKLRRL